MMAAASIHYHSPRLGGCSSTATVVTFLGRYWAFGVSNFFSMIKITDKNVQDSTKVA